MTTSPSYLKNLISLEPPRYLRMPSVGINISDNSVKLMDIEQTTHGLRPARFANRDMPNGAVESGAIEDPEAVAQVLRKLKADYDLKFITASIPEENGYVFSINIPDLSGGDIHDAISYQLPEHVPLAPHEAVFGHQVTRVDEKSGALSASVSVLPREIVEQYEALFTAAGLIPLSFEIESEAIRQAVVPTGATGATMTVDIGRSRTGIAIVDEGAVRYTSTLQLGGDQLTDATMEALSVSREEAEMIKQTEGFVRNHQHAKLHGALVKSIKALSDEIARRFRFWKTHKEGAGHHRSNIERIILVGGNASVPGLAEHISEQMDIPVAVGNVWTNLFSLDEYVPQIDFRHSLTYTASIGLALSRL